MKKLLFLVAAAVAGVSFAEQADHWTFDGSTITDGEWTFAATVAEGTTEMTVNAHSGNPSVASELDFSKPVTDSAETTYTIVTLNPQFNNDAAGKLISKLTLPLTITKIGDYAFNQCTMLTEIVNYIPDSVTRVGIQSFYKCPAKQELFVRGVAKFSSCEPRNDLFSKLAFAESSITKVTFGSALKVLADWASAPFRACASLETVVFDPEMTDAVFQGIRSGCFSGSGIKGTVDLTGFSNLSYVSDSGGASNPFSGTKIDTVIIGADCTKLGAKFFNGMGSLTTVKFMGPPPEIIKTVKTSSGYWCRTAGKLFDDKSADKTVVVYVTEEYKDQWLPYSATGEINDTDTKFSSDWATSVADVYLLIEGGGGGGGELGNWVFDGKEVSNGIWSFEATCLIRNLTIGACTKYPDEPSLLDFTDTFTDKNGNPLTIRALNTAFSSDKGVATTAASKVSELRLPLTLASIGAGAFGNLSKCTNVVNFLPDSVAAIGKYAFYKIPVQQDLSLKGIACLGTGPIGSQATQTFGLSGIKSVTFGPGLKDISSWDNGAFKDCRSITNVTFDAAMSGGKFSGIRNDGFHGCTALVGTVDLSGFENLSYVSDYGGGNNIFSSTKVEKFIVGEQCTKLAAGFFDGDTSLKEVVFMGPPPEITTNTNTSTGWAARKPSKFYNYGQSAIKITTYITKANREAWAPYVLYNGQPVDKVPPGKGVTWKPEYVTEGIDLSLRPVRVLDMVPGLMMIVK